MTDTADHRFPFAIVDVFADQAMSGNPLPVVFGADDLPIESMQRLAREFNLSEVTFILRPTKAGATWRLRSFTHLGMEVFSSGHHTLGAWWWLAESGRLDLTASRNSFAQEMGASISPIEIVADGGRPTAVVMDQDMAKFGPMVPDCAALASALGLTEDDLADAISPQLGSTGMPHILVGLTDREAVDRCKPDGPALLAIHESLGAIGCYVYSLDPRRETADAYARFFAPAGGEAWEDPASGSAAAPLACLLIVHSLAHGKSTLRIEQGTAMGRSSLIDVTVSPSRVTVAGRGFTLAEGTLRL